MTALPTTVALLLLLLSAVTLNVDAQCTSEDAGGVTKYTCASSTAFVNTVAWQAIAQCDFGNQNLQNFDGIEVAFQDESKPSQTYELELHHAAGQDEGCYFSSDAEPVNSIEFNYCAYSTINPTPGAIFPLNAVAIVKRGNDVVGCLKWGSPGDTVTVDCDLVVGDGAVPAAGDVFQLVSPPSATGVTLGMFKGEIRDDFLESFGPADGTNCKVGSFNNGQGFIGSNSAPAFVNEVLDVGVNECEGDLSTAYRGVEIAYSPYQAGGDLTVEVTGDGEPEQTKVTVDTTVSGWQFAWIPVDTGSPAGDISTGSVRVLNVNGTELNLVQWGSARKNLAYTITDTDLAANKRMALTGTAVQQPSDGDWGVSGSGCTPGAVNDDQAMVDLPGPSTTSSTTSTTSTSGPGGAAVPARGGSGVLGMLVAAVAVWATLI